MNWKLPAVLVAALAVIALIVWSLSDNEPAAAPHAGPELASLTAPPPAGSALHADGVREPDAAAAARREVAAPADGGTAPAPDTVVRGRLVTEQATPASGITVVLQSFPGGLDFGIPMPPPGSSRNPGVRTTSGKDGRFEFKVASDRGGWISIDDERHLLQKENIVGFKPSRAPIELGELTVILGATLAGVVQDERGRPLGAIKVGAYAGDGVFFGGGESSATSRDDGTFTIGKVRPGKVTLRTASPGWLPGVLEVEVKNAEQRRDLLLSLREGRAISGQVVDDLGAPVPHLKVGAMRQEQRPGVSMERFTPDEATETDARGWFTLAGLAGDTANVRAWGRGYAPANETGVPAGTGNLVLTVQRLGAVQGVLRDRAGKPIAGSRVSASIQRGAQGGVGLALLDGLDFDLPDGRANATTGEDGTFLVENVPPGAVTVRAQGRGHRPAEQRGVNVRPGATTPDVALVADLGATLRATVTDAAGKPVAAAKVRVGAPSQDQGNGQVRMSAAVAVGNNGSGPVFDPSRQGAFGEATTGEDGVAEIHGLPMGAAVVDASHSQLAESRQQPVELPVAGTVECRLALRQGGFAEVSVVDRARAPLPGARFAVNGPLGSDARDRPATADAQGHARVGPLPAGSYEAQLLMDPEPQSMAGGLVFRAGGDRKLGASHVEFVIREGSETAVELVRPLLGRLFGTVTDATGPVAGVEVEAEPVREGDAQGPADARNTHSNAGGRYEIANLEPGRYLLRYGKPGQSAKASEEVEIPASSAEVERDLRLRYGKLKVTVRNKADGEPVEGAEVSLMRGGSGQGPRPRERRMMMVTMNLNNDGASESTTMTMGDTRVKTDVDGVAEIADVPAGTWLVRVRDDKHVQVDLPDQGVVEGALQDCGIVQMDQAGRIRGRVFDKDGKQLPMAMVSYRRADGGEAEREPAMGGSFNLRGLRPGKWLLKAQALVMGPGEAPWGQETEVEVQAGKVQSSDLQVPGR